MSLADDKRLLVEIASLYYEQNKTQEEIAQKNEHQPIIGFKVFG
jgi:DNA-binding transcriptional regulator LsrR (DeoR family)